MTERREAGFVLLIVLWALVALSLILAHLLAAGRSEVEIADNLRRSAAAEAVADGAVQEALFRLLAGGIDGSLPGRTYVVRIGRSDATVAIDSLSGRINPNIADLPVLSALIQQCSATPAQANALAGAIVRWRGSPLVPGADPAFGYAGVGYAPPGEPLETLDELRLVVGMTPAMYACLAPHLSLFQLGVPASRASDPAVARAMAVAALQGEPAGNRPTSTKGMAEITATALVDGARFVRRATARLAPQVRILVWEAP